MYIILKIKSDSGFKINKRRKSFLNIFRKKDSNTSMYVNTINWKNVMLILYCVKLINNLSLLFS